MNYCRLMLASLLVLVAGMASMEFAWGQTETEVATTAEKKEAAPADPTGTWKWEVEFGENSAEFKLKLNWDGKKLTGKYTAFDNTTEIEQARLEKDQISFVDKREFNGNEVVAEFKGKVKPDDIEGTVTVDFGGQGPQDFDWNPERAVEIDDVVGTWDLRVETANGVVEPKLIVTKDGDKLKGKSISQVFGELEAKNLTLKDNELSWEISGSNGGFDISVKYKGKPRGNTIEGTNEFSVGDGDSGTMKFTGKRTPPEGKEKSAAEAKPATAATQAAEAKPADTNDN
jgi:hypothetical protein